MSTGTLKALQAYKAPKTGHGSINALITNNFFSFIRESLTICDKFSYNPRILLKGSRFDYLNYAIRRVDQRCCVNPFHSWVCSKSVVYAVDEVFADVGGDNTS